MFHCPEQYGGPYFGTIFLGYVYGRYNGKTFTIYTNGIGSFWIFLQVTRFTGRFFCTQGPQLGTRTLLICCRVFDYIGVRGFGCFPEISVRFLVLSVFSTDFTTSSLF